MSRDPRDSALESTEADKWLMDKLFKKSDVFFMPTRIMKDKSISKLTVLNVTNRPFYSFMND